MIALAKLPIPEGQDFHLSLQFKHGRWKAICALFDDETGKRVGPAGVGYSDDRLEAVTKALKDLTR